MSRLLRAKKKNSDKRQNWKKNSFSCQVSFYLSKSKKKKSVWKKCIKSPCTIAQEERVEGTCDSAVSKFFFSHLYANEVASRAGLETNLLVVLLSRTVRSPVRGDLKEADAATMSPDGGGTLGDVGWPADQTRGERDSRSRLRCSWRPPLNCPAADEIRVTRMVPRPDETQFFHIIWSAICWLVLERPSITG